MSKLFKACKTKSEKIKGGYYISLTSLQLSSGIQ